MLLRDYFEQVSTVLDDGPMLSKAVQVFVGPQWDVTSADADALCELGVALRDEEGVLRGFSRTFEEYLRIVGRNIDIWPLWRETERVLRDALEKHLARAFGAGWPDALCRARPKRKGLIQSCREKQARERERFGVRAEASLLAYTYPKELYELMAADWAKLGEPLLGSDKQGWALKFDVLSKVRTPLAHNREEAVSDGERDQAKGICQEILDPVPQVRCMSPDQRRAEDGDRLPPAAASVRQRCPAAETGGGTRHPPLQVAAPELAQVRRSSSMNTCRPASSSARCTTRR